MRYPFSPELLDALPEELAELFRGLELTLLEEICSRLRLSGELNEVTIQDIRALRSHGVDLEEIKRAISQATGTGMEKLEELLDGVVARNQAYYTSLADLAHVTAPEVLVGHEDIYAIYEQTRGTYRNLTRSMGFLVRQGRRRVMLPPGRAYQWALDSALLQVQSGAISYNQAIAEAVRQLADSGLRTVEYDSGHVDSVDVAVRRALMSGVNQINQKYREQSMDYLETDLVEVTAHSGARDSGTGPANHKSWQGEVYRWSEKPRASKGRYPDLVAVTGYGTGEGLGGWNCRHSFWPFIEGVSERAYTDQELANIDPPPVTFEGRTYTAYQATQKQRSLERTIRKQRRLKTSYEAAGLTEEAAAAGSRLNVLNRKYRAFSKAAGLPEQRERMRTLDAANIVSHGQGAGSTRSGSPGKPVQIATVDFSDRRAVLAQIDAAQQETAELEYEVNRTITTDGKVWRVSGESGFVNPSAIPSNLNGSYSYHNHPASKTWFSFSAEDVRFFFESGASYAKASDYLFEYVIEKMPKTIATLPETVYNRFKEIYRTDIYQLSAKGEIDIDRDGFHEVMSRLSQEFRFHYIRYRRFAGNGNQ